MPSAVPCSLSPLISRIHSYLFSDWRRTVSSKFFDIQIPSNSTEKLVLAVVSLVYGFKDTAFFQVLISLGLAELRILMQRLRTLVPGHLSSHSVLSSYGLFAPLALWRLSVSLRPLDQALGISGFWGSMVFRHAPIPRNGWGSNNNNGGGIYRSYSRLTMSYLYKAMILPHPKHKYFLETFER